MLDSLDLLSLLKLEATFSSGRTCEQQLLGGGDGAQQGDELALTVLQPVPLVHHHVPAHPRGPTGWGQQSVHFLTGRETNTATSRDHCDGSRVRISASIVLIL